MENRQNPVREDKVDIGFWQLARSTLAAFIGVQSNANRERDFRHGKVAHFIAMGLIFGALFVLTLVGIVQLVLHLAGN